MSEEFRLKFKAELDGREDFRSFFDENTRGATRLQGVLSSAGSAISSFAGTAKSELGSFAGKELGGSLGSQARGVLQLRDALNQLAVTSGGGAEMVSGLKEQVQTTSVAFNQLQGDVTEALQSFVEKTGDLETARANLATYAKVATAATAAISDVAQVGADLKEKLDIRDQAKAFALLITLSKQGSIEMRDFAKQAPRLFSVATSAGVTGEAGLREIGALTEVYGKYVGGSGAARAARASTAVENTFASIAKKSARLEQAGIKVEGRDRFDVLFDIIRRTGGNETKLREVFSQQAMRGILGLANEYKKTGKFGDFERFRALDADASVIDRDFRTRTSTGAAKIKSVQIERQKFVDQYFGGIAEFGAAHLNALQAGAVGLGFAGKGLGMLGGIVGGKVGGALGAATAQRVFVVNWPGGFGGSLPAAGGGAGSLATKLGVAGAVLGAGLYGIEKFKEAGEERIGAVENAGVEINRNQLEMKRRARESKVAMLERQGFEHGRAIYLAENQVKNNIKIEIHGNEATITEGDGTRSTVNLERRKAAGD